MTLSPVFRSPDAVRLLEESGVWDRMGIDISGQARAVRQLHEDLTDLIDETYLSEAPSLPRDGSGTESGPGLRFLQEYFFLILFRSLFRSLGVEEAHLDLYSELDFCIKGTITAADNLFDDQGKSLLPLRSGEGSRFLSILQLLCFERLIQRALERAEDRGIATREKGRRVLRGLMNRMASIGVLEGSEEGGVEEIPPPETMVERVHRVRGGALFALAFVAPSILEDGEVEEGIRKAEPAVARLGTAFQIVDDLTDFEFDLDRRSHNLLVSQIRHLGTAEEQDALERFWHGAPVPEGMVEDLFSTSARAILERAYQEARGSFQSLSRLGFWFPPELSDQVVHAIVGLEGVARMEAVKTGG